MLALYVVNNFADLTVDNTPVIGSLRQAVQLANANAEVHDTIIFRPDLFDGQFSQTIFLEGGDGGGALMLSDPAGVDIIGPGPLKLTVAAAGLHRVFIVDDGADDNIADVNISGIAIANGNPLGDDNDGRGGGILNRESLYLEEVLVMNNSATEGGGIFNDNGARLEIVRSMIQDNTADTNGGGIQNGVIGEEENLANATILNSTITGNQAFGVPGEEDEPTGYGGGLFNASGETNVEQSTVVGNLAATDGGGLASMGFDAMFEEGMGDPPPPPTPTVFEGFATLNIRSSIVVGNWAMTSFGGAEDTDFNDVASVGMTEESEEDPAMPFEPQINSEGYNLFGVLTHPAMSVNMMVTLPPNGPGDQDGITPAEVFFMDGPPPDARPILADYGGVLPVFMPDPSIPNNPAIDFGDPNNVVGPYDQRGSQFVREVNQFGSMGRMDIGAAEVQIGNFLVNALVDETDGRYSDVPFSDGGFLSFLPDFSLREALEAVEKINQIGIPATSIIRFDDVLTDPDLNPDPTIGTAAPTILLELGQFLINFPVIIEGPAFELEIDADGDSRVFNIQSTVDIENLVIRGGSAQEFGGGILVNGDLTLVNSTLRNNATTGTGGAIYVAGGSLYLDSSTLHNNTSSGDGGGIYIAAGGNVTVHNSTISGNTAQLRGGGIANAAGLLLVRYSTITNNTAASTIGSGVAHFRNAGAVTGFRSSIVSANVGTDVQHVLSGANNVSSLGYNLVGTGNAVTGGFFANNDIINSNPMLGALTKLGGPTSVHRLLAGSPAIDAGDPNNAGLGDVPDYDQRGFPFDRIEGGVRIDIGAYEIQDDVLLVGNGDPAEGSYPTFIAALTDANLTPTKETIVFLPSWPGEFFPGGLIEITDSVDIIGFFGMNFFGIPTLTIEIDDGDNNSLSDVSFSRIRFENNTRVVSLENLTFDEMEFVNNAATANGGAISQQNGDLTILNSSFIGNSVSGTGVSGGAIHVLNGNLHMENSLVTGNSTGAGGGDGGAIYLRNGEFTGSYLYLTGNEGGSATGDGGALYLRDATVNLNQAIISGNSTSGSNSEGGGIAARDSDITLTNSYVTFNSTTGTQASGGGIFLNGGSLTLDNVIVALNETSGQSASGGGIASLNADVTITGSSVSQNEVHGLSAHGGGIYAVGGDLTIRDSAVTTNHADAVGSKGGGVYSDTNLTGTQNALIINSTISGNTAEFRGGGVYNADGSMDIKYSTITNNSVTYFGNGGGVASVGNSSTTRTRVLSSIIAGNFATNDPVNPNSDVENVAGNLTNSFVSLGYNLIGKGVALAVNTFVQAGDIRNNTDPGLAPLANNGGPTSTHALLPDSPAINGGTPGVTPGSGNTPEFDQRGSANGVSRVVNGRMDIGAFESDLSPAIVFDPTDFNEDGETSGLDFLMWQIGFGTPNATKSDGDSDGDEDVDGDDLANWEAAYGSESLVAAVQAGPAEASVEPLAASDGLTASALLAEPTEDAQPSSANQPAGMTVIVTGLGVGSPGTAGEDSVLADEEAAIDASLAEYGQNSGGLAASRDDDFGDIAVRRSSADEESQWEEDFSAEDSVFAMLGEGVF